MNWISNAQRIVLNIWNGHDNNYSSESSSSTACHFSLFFFFFCSLYFHALYTRPRQPDDDIYNKVLIGDGNKPRTAPLARRRAPQFSNQPQQQQQQPQRPRQQTYVPRRPAAAQAPKVVAPANRLPSYPAFYSRSVPVRQLSRAVWNTTKDMIDEPFLD